MKKIFQSLFVLMGVSMLLAACAKELQAPAEDLGGELQTVTFTAGIPTEMGTKAAADNDGNGALVNRCIMEIYYADQLFERKYAAVNNKTATFTTDLPANRTYKVAFWADCVADPSTSDGLAADRFYTTNATDGLQAVAIKGTYAGNSDARDAFALCKEYTVAQGGSSFVAVLHRPFAQINVITTDIATVAKVSTLKPDQVTLTINNAVTSYNVLDSTAVSGATQNLTYTADVYNWDAAESECTLSMDYIFAEKTKGVIDIAWAAGQGTAATTVSHAFANIPYQRNYRTNIKGALLTTTGQWNVTVDPIWESATQGEHNVVVVAATVDDIDGMNSFVSTHPEATQYDVTFSQVPNDAGVPSGDPEGAHSILTTPLGDGDVMNVAVETNTETLYVGDFVNQNSTTLTSESTQAATVNINVPEGKKITTLVINAPSKSVYLNGQLVASAGTLTNVESTTSQNTLVVEAGQQICTLTVHQGGLEIHGSVTSLVISEDAHETNPVKVRACENLSASVFAVIKGDSPSAHDYIDRPMYVEKANATDPVTYDIVPAVCKIGSMGYSSVAAALSAVQNGETIVMLQNDVLTQGQTITLENNEAFTLDLNGKTISIAETGFDFSANGTNVALRDGVPSRFAIVVDGNGTFNICDSSAGASGAITALNHNYGTVKAILVDGNAIVNVNSGNISGGYAAFYAIGYTGTDPVDPATAPKPTLNINGGKVLGGSSAIGIKGNTAKLSISAGVVESTGYYGVVTNGTQDWYDGGNSCITISGGTIKGTIGAAMYLPAESPTTITGGYFEGTEGIVVKGGSVTISGASVVINATGAYGEPGSGGSGYETTGSCIYVEDTYSNHAPIVNISAGTFSSANNQAVQYYTTKEAGAEDKGHVALTGGTYSSKPADDCIASGYRAVANGTQPETWTVESSPVCKIGSTYYNTLAEAVAAVPTTGEETTIQMIGDDDLGDFGTTGVEIAVTKNIILDLNGKTIKGNTKTTSNSQMIYNKGILTIVDNSSDQDGCIAGAAATSWKYNDDYDYSQSYASNTIYNSGTINVNSGIIYNGCASPNGSAAYAIDNANGSNGIINITGGKLETAKAAAVRMFGNASGAELNVSGNSILKSGGFAAFQVMGGDCKVNISAGTFQGSYGFTTWGIGDNAVITITGGVFESDSYVYRLNSEQITDGMVNISGGYFKGLASYNGRINLTGGYFKSNCYDDCELSSITESGYSVKANTDEETKDDYPWTVAKAPTPEGGVFQAATQAELDAVIAEINSNSAYWGSAYTIQLGAGTYGSDITIKQYPEWNGIEGNSGSGNNTSNATIANKTIITLKGADNFATKWEGAINVVGCGYSQSGDLKFGTDVVSTTIDGIYFDETTTLNKPTYVVTGKSACSNVIVKNCKFENCKYCTMLGDANSYSFNSHVEDCTITDCEVVCSGRVHGDIGFVMKNLEVTGLSKGFFNVQASGNSSVNNCNVTFTSTAEYGIRNSDAATVYVKDCTFTSLPESKPFTFIRKDGTVFTLENVDCSESSKILKFNSAYANSKVILKGTTSPAEFTNEGGSDNNVDDQR